MTVDLLTAALVIITAFYAWVTYKILQANKKVVEVMQEQSLATTRPYIVVAPILEFGNPIFYLRISNNGKTAATNLRMTLDKSFYKFGNVSAEKDLAKLAAFSQKIDAFPPGAEMTFSLAQGFVVFAETSENPNMPQTFCVTAEYEFQGKRVKEANQVDLRPYLEADVPQDAYHRKMGEIVKSLETIADNIAAKRGRIP